MKKFWIVRALKIGVFVVLAVLAVGFVVMSLWNWLIPSLFHGPAINFCQALGILVLSKILFGGFKKGGHCGGHCHRGDGNWKSHWKNRWDWRSKWEEKLSKMSPEEREKIKQKLKNKCGSWMEDPFTEKDDTKNEE